MNAQVKVPAEWNHETAELFRDVLENVVADLPEDWKSAAFQVLRGEAGPHRVNVYRGEAMGGTKYPYASRNKIGEELWKDFLQQCVDAYGAEIVIKTWAQFWGPGGVPIDDLPLAARHSAWLEKQRPRNVL